MEFLFVIGAVLLLFILLAAVIYEKRLETSRTSSALSRLGLCHELSSNIVSVYNGGDGATSRIMPLPYNVSISPSSRLIEIISRGERDDFVTCTIPIEKVVYYDTAHNYYNGSVEGYISSLQGYNNSAYPAFNINTTSIQLENIGGRVFISSRCNINEIDFAEVQSIQGNYNPVMLPLKSLDNKTLELLAGMRGEAGEGEYMFNVAYAKLGSPYCILSVLQELGYTGSDQCVEYKKGNPQSKCDIFYNTNLIRDYLLNPNTPDFTNWYNIIIYEDVQNLNPSQLSMYEERIKSGAWALLSGQVLDSSSGYAFGAYLYTNTPSGGTASLVQQDPEGFFSPLSRSPITFSGTGSAVNLGGLVNYYSLYRFNNPPQNDAVARWKYMDSGEPHGDVYYFNNYCDMLPEVKELLKNILSVEYFTYIYADFRISRTINENLQANNPVSLLAAHNIDNPSYELDYAWLGEINWCNLDNDALCTSWNQLDIEENGDIKRRDETEVIGKCENHISRYSQPRVAKCTFNLGSAAINNIRVKLKFTASTGSGQVPVKVDFIQLEGCYAG